MRIPSSSGMTPPRGSTPSSAHPHPDETHACSIAANTACRCRFCAATVARGSGRSALIYVSQDRRPHLTLHLQVPDVLRHRLRERDREDGRLAKERGAAPLVLDLPEVVI